MSEISFRLSTKIIPTDYDLEITPDIAGKTFTASEVITFQQNEPSPYAELFAESSIKIKTIEQNGKNLEYKHEGGRLYIYGDSLSSSPVKIIFDGEIQTNSVGFYYVDDECCSTQFEAIHARECFPCFDEPSIKSTFLLTLIVPKHLLALSNMPVKSTTLIGDKKRYQFHRTPKICSYLLAFAVGAFDVLSGFTTRGLPVDVYATSGKSDHLQFALDECIKFIDWYEDFIGVPFPLPRMQLLAVPEFSAGAMENYGLIIFREECLLASPSSSSASTLMNVSMTIAHELAHQWSGDSVSPKFWDSLWLNEGFATIFPYIAFDDVHPEWHFWEKFVILELSTALFSDASAHTHPVNVKVNSEEEIESVFDDICYSKAACVIYMLLTKLGRESFCKVLRSYFSEFNNSNADTSDLCNTFSKVLGYDMTKFFDAWTNHCNFPLVIVEEDLTIHQVKFTNDGIVEGKEYWPIPLSISVCKDGKVDEIILELEDKPIKLDSNYDWVKVNSNSKAFCRVWHKGKAFTNLLSAIRTKQLNPIDRWSILNDQRALAKIGIVSYVNILELLQYYNTEDNPFVCRIIANTFRSLISLFKQHKEQLKLLGMKTFKEMINKFGLLPKENEPIDVTLLRPTLLNITTFICEDSECITFGKKLFEQFKSNVNEIDPNLIDYVMKCGVMYSEDGFEYVSNIALHSDNPQLQSDAVFALCWVPKNKINNVIDMIEKVKLQDMTTVFQGISMNPYIERELWTYLKENYQKFFQLFSKISFNLETIIDSATSGFNTEEEAEEVETFFKENPTPVAEAGIKKRVEEIRMVAEIMKRDNDKVGEYLKSL
ncbi:puromycin-sensitive aminopeptidase isoform X2 [Histomonas meleagridis]|uniref:puromycin-sensitive aminopeptidase isoform X2 n=1 Tax=Histomonas meleagridis TaxID=135588 RepID=UPI00355A2EFD|nr:puromycin-sensitive aminopeptidase isoform X2 [Histomonas meleagridis]KAH0802501.1 puromycin-sensitive aminopeptidase isoform X2 [Histomonas meleagridis]